MFVIAWSFFIVISLVIATNEAFLASPVSVQAAAVTAAEAAAATDYDVTGLEKRLATNEVPHRAIQGNLPSVLRNESTVHEENGRRETIYVIEFESESTEKGDVVKNKGKDFPTGTSDGQSPLDPWSIVWYIGSFGGLVAFFLIVSCSEWCCRRNNGRQAGPYGQRNGAGGITNAAANGSTSVNETPPPPYHLFAPPSYDSVNYADIVDKSSGEKLDIYVISVPIHRPPIVPPPV